MKRIMYFIMCMMLLISCKEVAKEAQDSCKKDVGYITELDVIGTIDTTKTMDDVISVLGTPGGKEYSTNVTILLYTYHKSTLDIAPTNLVITIDKFTNLVKKVESKKITDIKF